MRTLRHLCHLPHQLPGHLQLAHLGREFQFRPRVQPHHLFDGQSLLHRLLKRNAHPRRCRHGQRALHIHHDGREVRLPVLQRQMRLQRHSVHGGSVHQQAQIVPEQLDRCDVVGARGRGRRFCQLELCRGCDAVDRRRGGRTRVLRIERGPGHLRLRRDAGGRFLQLRVQELRSLISGGGLSTSPLYIAGFHDIQKARRSGRANRERSQQYLLRRDGDISTGVEIHVVDIWRLYTECTRIVMRDLYLSSLRCF